MFLLFCYNVGRFGDDRYAAIYWKNYFNFCIFIFSCCIFFHRNQSPSYIDTINAMDVSTSNIFAVGTNNANDKELSKAKFAKYDFNRQKIFEKVYNKGYRSNFNDVLFDEDDVVLVGSYESSKKDHQNSISTAIILKYDTDGNLLFEKEYPVLSDTDFFRVLSMDYGYLAIGT